MRDYEGRFMSKVKKSDGCWLWTGCLNAGGYGQFNANGRRHPAHRFSYEMFVGQVPEGRELDHLCRVRRCVRPDHLEPVDRRTNVLRGISFAAANARKTKCSRGHAYTNESVYYYARLGSRTCRICHALNNVAYRARKKAM